MLDVRDHRQLQHELRTLDVGDVITDPQALAAASVDRFRKYTAVHGIFDGPLPAAIVQVRSTDDVSRLLAFADEQRLPIVPRTGGTSTEGGLETPLANTIVLDAAAMDAVLEIDEIDMMATVQCGVRLQVLEDQLRARGLTTGHSPQSKPLAQFGGLVATRSIGQFSTLYGGIEDLVIGLEAVLPDGAVVRIRNVPRRAAGPDLRHLLIGSEGGLAVITEVTVKVFRFYPDSFHYRGALVDDFSDGVRALREVVTAGYRPSVARLYSPQDAAQHFGEELIGDRNLVVFVSEGPPPLAEATDAAAAQAISAVPHLPVDSAVIEEWFTNLNWGPDKIEAEKESMRRNAHLGYTTEVSCDWSQVSALYEAVMRRVRTEFDRAADLTMLGAHSSHSYQTGTNLYFVYDYEIRCEPREEIELYHKPINAIVVTEALRVGGSIVHHHGIGKYRTPWVEVEHGSSYRLLEGLKQQLDPNGIMNPGTIWPLPGEEFRTRFAPRDPA